MFRIVNVNHYFYHRLVIVIFIVCGVHGLPFGDELFEGSPCTMENGSAGLCKKLPECPPRIAEVKSGRRTNGSNGRCGFENFTEIVCCPLSVSAKIGIRAADAACHEYENEVTSNSGDGDENTDDNGLHFNIFNGARAAVGEFPYMAALGYENTDSETEGPIAYICGGALISSLYVLTAAHCVNNIGNRVPVTVRMGSEFLAPGIADVQDINVSKIISHPEFKRSLNYNDIALVRLSEPAKISNTVKPVCLQTRSLSRTNVTEETSFVAIGFGATSFDTTYSDTLMKTANLSLVPNEDCGRHYTGFGKLPTGLDKNMLCAVDGNSTRGSDACQGDSGGPLIMISDAAHSVVGVTSFGQSCGGPTPAVYTSVHSYLDWIESHVWPLQSKA